MSIPIVQVKLRPPELREGHVPRRRLFSQLKLALERKLTLVIASAGSGKSALLAEWAGEIENVVWYSIDASDRDPAVFIAYLLSGLRELWPDFGHTTEAILNRPAPPDPQHLVLTLISELEPVLEGTPLLVILDDYQQEGSHMINVNTEELLAGYYVYKMYYQDKTGSVKTGSMIKIR